MNAPRSPLDHLARGIWHKLAGLFAKTLSPILTIALARLFAPEVFGQYVALQLLALTLARVGILGMDKAMAWQAPQARLVDAVPPLWPAARRVALRSALLAAGLALGYHRLAEAFPSLFASAPFEIALLCFLAVPAFAGVQFLCVALEGAYQPQYKVWVQDVLLYAAIPPLALVLRASGLGDASLAAAFLVACWASLAALLPAFFRAYPLRRLREHRRMPSEVSAYAWPQGWADVIGSVLLRLDLWMILALMGGQAAGAYAIMLTLSNGVKTIRQGFDSLLLPAVSGLAAGGKRAWLPRAYSFTVGRVTALQMAVALVVFCFPGELLSIAGKGYVVQPQALLVLLLGNLLNGFFAIQGQVLAGLGKSRTLLAMQLLVLAVNAAGNLWLIPKWGLIGAALATAVASMVQNLVWTWQQHRLTGLNLYAPALYGQLACILAFGAGSFWAFPRVEFWAFSERFALFVLLALAYAPIARALLRGTRLLGPS